MPAAVLQPSGSAGRGHVGQSGRWPAHSYSQPSPQSAPRGPHCFQTCPLQVGSRICAAWQGATCCFVGCGEVMPHAWEAGRWGMRCSWPVGMGGLQKGWMMWQSGWPVGCGDQLPLPGKPQPSHTRQRMRLGSCSGRRLPSCHPVAASWWTVAPGRAGRQPQLPHQLPHPCSHHLLSLAACMGFIRCHSWPENHFVDMMSCFHEGVMRYKRPPWSMLARGHQHLDALQKDKNAEKTPPLTACQGSI